MALLGAKALKADFQNLKKGTSTKTLRRAIRTAAKITQKRTAQLAPKNKRRGKETLTFKDGSKKRKLKSSIRVKNIKNPKGVTGQVSVHIGWLKTAFHGNFIHAGTPGHVIRVKSKKILRTAQGKFLGKEQKVSGISKNPFLHNAYRQTRGAVDKQIRADLAFRLKVAAKRAGSA